MPKTLPKQKECASRAGSLLDHYRRLCNAPDGEEDKTLVADLLADLMHLADRERIDFWECLRIAQDHHREEALGNP